MGRRRTAATLKSTQHGQVTASLLCHAGDAGRAGELASMLAAAGVTVVGGAEADGTVVFLSAEGLSQPGWLDEPISSVRLIPVRVGAIRPNTAYLRVRESWQGSDLLFRGVLEMRRAPW